MLTWNEYIPPGETLVPDSQRFNSFGDFLGVAINLMLGTGIAISVIAMVISGIKYITSGGDFKATADARKALTYSIVAFLICISAFTIKAIITGAIGANSIGGTNVIPEF